MQILEKSPKILEQLREFDLFRGVEASALQWLIDRSDYLYYDAGEHVFQPDQPINHMQVILEGGLVIEMEQAGELREISTWEKGCVTGLLPFSRMRASKAYATAMSPTYSLALHRDRFTEMVNTSYELTQALVSVMTSRVRDFSQMQSQNEKLMALGKLSAGLAHELNNPASAMVRSAEELYKALHQTPERFKEIITMRISAEQTDRVNAILFARLPDLHKTDLSTVERMDKEEALVDWMDDRGIDDAEAIADTMVDFGFTLEDLDAIEAIVEGRHLATLLWWIESTLHMEKTVTDIREASDRISKLVRSVKSYTHMDRGGSRDFVDLNDGLRSTLLMLKHKLKQKNIRVAKELGEALPKVEAFPGELNQVWTNLIVNAVDAMEEGGSLTLRTYAERRFVCAEVEDNGEGIPEEYQTRIFDPFFTTKSISEGTGMGLDIVKRIINRHKAEIKLQSQPGKTVFKLCFPLRLTPESKENSDHHQPGAATDSLNQQ